MRDLLGPRGFEYLEGQTMSGLAVYTEPCDDGYISKCERTPGCWGFGMTRLEALDEFCVALPGWYLLSEQLGAKNLPVLDVTRTF